MNCPGRRPERHANRDVTGQDMARPRTAIAGLTSIVAGVLTASVLLVAGPAISQASAATENLGTTIDTFAVLGGSTVTNTGTSVLDGSLGVAPGTSITGFGPGIVNNGTVHDNDGVAQQAQTELTTAFNTAFTQPSTGSITSDLAGSNLDPGVYTAPTSMGLSGDLTLNAHGDSSAIFIFQAGTSLTTGSGARVLLLGGAQACNVYWEVGSSATIGTGSAFVGNVMAYSSVTMNTGATLQGRALAETGAVTLDTNTITKAECTTTTGGTGGTTGGGTTGGTTGTTGGTTGTTGGTTGTTGGTTRGTTGGTTGGTGGATGKGGTTRPTPIGSVNKTNKSKLAAQRRARRLAAQRRTERLTRQRRAQRLATQRRAERLRLTRARAHRQHSQGRPPTGTGGFTG